MIFCEKDDCIYRSKRKCSSYTLGKKPAYKCKAKNTVISFYADGNSDMYTPPLNACQCLTYRSVKEE